MNEGGYTRTKWILPILALCAMVFLFLSPTWAVAQIDTGLTTFQETTGLGNEDIRLTIAKIVRVVLGFLGIIAVVIVLYAGFMWMTAAGNEDRVTKAKSILINGGIGLFIVMAAFGITQFVVSRLEGATGTELGFGGTLGGGGVGMGGFKSSSALGSIIESHYPDRNETGVPRNVTIVVTFRVPIDAGSVLTLPQGKTTPLGTPQENNGVVLYDELKSGVVEIYPTTGALKDKSLADKLVKNIRVTVSPDKKTFLFEPADLLGSATESVGYTVHLTSAILNAAGKPLFTGANKDYEWSFSVSTVVDTTPPKVVSTFPMLKTEKPTPRNVGVMVTFNEPILPITAAGAVADGYGLMVVGKVGDDQKVQPTLGTFRITNAYRTVEFQADDASNFCGKNACGKDAFCLPANARMQVLVKAADVKNPGGSDPAAKVNLLAFPQTFGFNGIVDMQKNSLDGGGESGAQSDGKAAGPPSDNFFFGFQTSSLKDLTAPKILSVSPSILDTNVKLDAQPQMMFNKPMMYSAMSEVALTTDPAGLGVGFSKMFSEEPLDDKDPVASLYDTRTAMTLHHGTPFAADGKYSPHVPSTIMDAAYNCFYPAQDTATCKGTNEQKPWCCNGNPSESECIPAGS